MIRTTFDHRAMIGATRACPDCGRPQHYTGVEAGWCHDATWGTWDCADPRKTGALTERARQIIADPFAAAFDGVEEAEE